MRPSFSIHYALEWICAAAASLAAVVTVYSFLTGHFVIPTISLANAVLLAHLAWFGFRDEPWARKVLFWGAFILGAHCFFALFWAKTPPLLLGDAFVPVYGCGALLFALLAAMRGREILK